MRIFKHLRPQERERLFQLLRQRKTQAEIAKELERNKGTISREIKRNTHQLLDEYLPDTAQKKANRRKAQGRKKSYLERYPRLKAYVLKKLLSGWTPDLIAGKLRGQGKDYLTKESIYQYVYSLEGRKLNLRQYLPRAHRIRRKRNGRKHRKVMIPHRVDITRRPKLVEARSQFGHWEGDSVSYQGHSQRLATQVERKSRLLVILRPRTNAARERASLINRRFSILPVQARRTITFDNGLEFSDHQRVTKTIGTKVYFAKPYASWQRGSNENLNGILRRYLPRTTDLDTLTPKELNKIVNHINNRPRKILNYQTPREVFDKQINRLNRNRNIF
jgi:IS30 family transposase